LTLFLLYVCPIPAQNQVTIDQAYQTIRNGKMPQKQSRDDDEWLTFPYAIQLSPYVGLAKEIPRLLKLMILKKFATLAHDRGKFGHIYF
jgi:hypothetical protein